MSLRICCPHCGAQSTVDDRYVGKMALCGGCEEPIIITREVTSHSPRMPKEFFRAPAPQPAASPDLFIDDERPTRKRKTGLLILVGFAAVMLVIALAGYRSWHSSPSGNSKAYCQHNLHQIAMALHAYHEDYGQFPPAFVADESGYPMHSWRVLILPYLAEEELYSEYDFGEPWNGPNNAQLQQRMPEVYACPSADVYDEGTTSYKVVVGRFTMFPFEHSRSIESMQDPPSETILVVEVADSHTNWMMPADLNGDGRLIASKHDGGAHVAMVDGSVRFLSSRLSRDEIEQMLDPNDVITPQLDSLVK